MTPLMALRVGRANCVRLLRAPLMLVLSAVPAAIAAQVSVTPNGGSATVASSGTFAVAFTVTNTGFDVDSYTLSCTRSGAVASCSAPSSVEVQAGASAQVSVTYVTGSTGSGTVILRAVSDNYIMDDDEGDYSITIGVTSLSVTPDGQAIRVQESSAQSASFTLQNTGSVSVTVTFATACTGTGVSGCSTPGSRALAAGQSAPITVTYLSGTHGNTGRVRLTATTGAVSDSGWFTITSGVTAPLVVSAASNTGMVIERDLCLTVAAGESAAYECGDLRLVHALPRVRTLGKDRAPTMFYNSQHASPYPVIGAVVSQLDAAPPNRVTARLLINGIPRASGEWPGSDWANGARRISIGFDAMADPTDVYSYQLEVRNWVGDSSSATTSAGELIIVNRQSSVFGAGWWIAGVEQLLIRVDGTRLWVGGDGSARLYRPVGTDVWAADAVDRPDTLVWEGTRYVRALPHGLKVKFDGSGRHLETENRLGHVTSFSYMASGSLEFISIPPTSANYRYLFLYSQTTGLLSSVHAPGTFGTWRMTQFTMNAGRLVSIDDPDEPPAGNHGLHEPSLGDGGEPWRVEFRYPTTTSRRVTTRTNRRGHATHFAYDAGNRLRQSHTDLDIAPWQIMAHYRVAEVAGLAGGPSVDTALTYSMLDGPRTDVADTSLFWLDRFGSPRKIRNAAGHITTLERTNAAYPSLVTRLRQPNGRVMRARYDVRGNLEMVVDSGTIDAGQVATTRYRFDPTWDFVTLIDPPMRDSVRFDYDPVNGNRRWQQDARGPGSRVDYFYAANGLMNAVKTALSPPESLFHDVLGNIERVRSPLGIDVRYFKDALGRDTLVETPVSDSIHGRTFLLRQRTLWDDMDQDTLSIFSAPSDSATYHYSPTSYERTFWWGPTVRVGKKFDQNGNLREITRDAWMTDQGITSRTTNPMTTRFRYDYADRKVRETAPDGYRDSLRYDAAGNLIERISRRGRSVFMQYDAMNRLSQRRVPFVTYPRESYAGAEMPHYRNTLTNALLFPGGLSIEELVDTLTYDEMGNVLTANNADARVTREYNVNGTVRREVQRIRTYAGADFTTHSYDLRYTYDLNGRRRTMRHPLNLHSTVTTERNEVPDTLTRYAYHPFGPLQTITSPRRFITGYFYDAESRLDSMAFGNGAWEKRYYDGEGKVTRQLAKTSDSSSSGHPPSGIVHDFRLAYDSRGRITSVRDRNERFWHRYTAAGAAARSASDYWSDVSQAWVLNNVDTWEVDALNAITTHRTLSGSFSVTRDTLTYQATTGRIDRKAAQGNDVWRWLAPAVHDPSGNLHLSEQERLATTCGYSGELCEQQWGGSRDRYYFREVTANYYGADERLRVSDRKTSDNVFYQHVGGLEEYRYDALGRRVLRRYRADPRSTSTSWEYAGEIVRYVYDGEQILFEIRMPGQDSASAATLERDYDINYADPRYGIVQYTHGLALDRPVSVSRVDPQWFIGGNTVFLHENYRGYFHKGTLWNGARDGGHVDWLGRRITSYLEKQSSYGAGTGESHPFFGSLLDVQTDGSAQVYMRNRYYDPATGRFTQEDPIGLAGGLNLYGFAGGDPVNFSDPFGLNPIAIGYAIFEAGSTAYDLYDLGKTAYRYSRGRESKGALAVTTAGVGIGLFGFGGGYGRLARQAMGSLDELSAAARALDPADAGGQFTKAGRALSKHKTVFGDPGGGPANFNSAAQGIVDDILTDPGSKFTARHHARFGDVIEVRAPDGRGVRYNKNREFINFLEPNK